MNNLVFLDFKVTIRTPLLQVLKLQKKPDTPNLGVSRYRYTFLLTFKALYILQVF